MKSSGIIKKLSVKKNVPPKIPLSKIPTTAVIKKDFFMKCKEMINTAKNHLQSKFHTITPPSTKRTSPLHQGLKLLNLSLWKPWNPDKLTIESRAKYNHLTYHNLIQKKFILMIPMNSSSLIHSGLMESLSKEVQGSNKREGKTITNCQIQTYRQTVCNK